MEIVKHIYVFVNLRYIRFGFFHAFMILYFYIFSGGINFE